MIDDRCFCGAEWVDEREECAAGHGFGEADRLRGRAEAAEARVVELATALAGVIATNSHSGSCCTYDEVGKVIVTVESCKCHAPWKAARLALGWGAGSPFERIRRGAGLERETHPIGTVRE